MKTALLVLLGLALSASQACASPDERALGSTHWVGSQYFQYLGPDEGSDLWLYRHLDGTVELFSDSAQANDSGQGRWSGSLGSEYDPAQGVFLARFEALETLETLLANGTPKSRKRLAARRLALFLRLHPSGDPGPYYLQQAEKALRKHLGDEGAAWVDGSTSTHQRLLARVAHPGTRILPSPATLRSSDDHYRSLVADGYLDLAIVGGNSEDLETGEFYSPGMASDLLAGLRDQGFALRPRARESNLVDCERTTELFGQRVRIRVRLTAAAHDSAPVRRTVANFVEGLANADVLIYFGHSNEGSGYYLSETRSSFGRFRLGSSSEGADVGTKCYGVGGRAYQIVALNSCLSYERYCVPMRTFCDEREEATAPGFVGTARKVPVDDFAPRFARLIELLARGAGPRELAREINAIRPHGPDSPELLFRGVLQPRYSFVVPPGVTIQSIQERGPKAGFVVKGAGSDGLSYDSSGVFPQDEPGEIVQTVPESKGVYGVTRDGRLLLVSDQTQGAPVELVTPTDDRRVVFAAWVKQRSKRRLYLLGSDGGLRYLSRAKDRLIDPEHAPPPAGVRLVAIGSDSDGRLVARDEGGQTFASSKRRWERLDEPVELVATPSLWGDGALSFGE